MRIRIIAASFAAALVISAPAVAGNEEIELLKQQMNALKQDYEARIQALENRIEAVVNDAQEAKSEARQVSMDLAQKPASPGRTDTRPNSFNPAISLILDGRSSSIDDTELSLPGFQLGGEAGLPEDGFATGHNELVMSANIDNQFYGELSTAIVRDEGETEVELEEAFIETLGLGHGLTLKAGQFYSGIGYLNAVHDHAHDFADRPLVYEALLGGHLLDTGVQARWVAPTDTYLLFGAELLSGSEYPSGENGSNAEGFSVFAKTGGDIGVSSSWQLGASYYTADFDVREAGGHHHGEGEPEVDNELRDGSVELYGLDFVYKWAPQGNSRARNFIFQTEYFFRDEDGDAQFSEGDDLAEARYDGEQSGFYAQAIYQFIPRWRIGARYDYLNADNDISDFVDGGIAFDEFLEESGLGDGGNPQKHTLMLDYSPSHFSRIRLQYSQLDSGRKGADNNDMLMLQYLMSLGSHGAHKY